MTKSFVAAVVLQLVAENKISLDDSLERWLPGIAPYAARVSVRQLLNHTSGAPDHVRMLSRFLHGSEAERVRPWPPRELIGLTARQPLQFPPGSAWSYSNTGYVFLGLIVEAITGRPLADELVRRIFLPLGLRSTSFPMGTTGIPEPMSRGYLPPLDAHGEIVDGPLVDVTVLDPSWAWAAGALISDLDDLAGFFRGLLDGSVLPPPLLDEMRTTVAVPAAALPYPLFDRYGLGLVEVDTPEGPLIGQPGGIPGYLNFVLCTPDGRRQLGVMINVGEIAPAAVIDVFIGGVRQLARRLLRS